MAVCQVLSLQRLGYPPPLKKKFTLVHVALYSSCCYASSLPLARRNHRPDHFYYQTNTYDGKYLNWVRKDEQNSGPAFE
jgi:hypothetical protein